MLDQLNKRKPKDVGLAVKRAIVFGLPALIIVGAIGVTVIGAAFNSPPEENEEIIKATPVVVEEALAHSAQLTVTTQGEVKPKTTINLAPQVSGKIVFVASEFIEGGAFEKGDVLIRVEPAEYQFRVVQALSNVAQAQSRYASEAAEANIARTEWEELGKGKGAALALREPQLAEAAAMLASAKAALDETQLQLARTTIRAPFKGRVRIKSVGIGEYVTPGIKLGEIFSTMTMEVPLPLTDTELGQLGLSVGFHQSANNIGPEVSLSGLVGGVMHSWKGRIIRTGNEYDRDTRVLFAYAEVEDPYGAGADAGAPLASGLFVTAVIQGREIQNSVIVPRTALRGNDEVFIARDDGTLEIRPVIVASSNRTRAVLVGGITHGERVITSPVRGAADGIEIAVAGDTEDLSEPAIIVEASN